MRELKKTENGRTCDFEYFEGGTRQVKCMKPAVRRVAGGFVCEEHLLYVRGVRPESLIKA